MILNILKKSLTSKLGFYQPIVRTRSIGVLVWVRQMEGDYLKYLFPRPPLLVRKRIYMRVDPSEHGILPTLQPMDGGDGKQSHQIFIFWEIIQNGWDFIRPPFSSRKFSNNKKSQSIWKNISQGGGRCRSRQLKLRVRQIWSNPADQQFLAKQMEMIAEKIIIKKNISEIYIFSVCFRKVFSDKRLKIEVI